MANDSTTTARLRLFQVATGNVGTEREHMILPKPGTDFSSAEAFAAVGMRVTGMPVLNSIRAVVDAEPGIVTSADLPLRAFAGRFVGTVS